MDYDEKYFAGNPTALLAWRRRQIRIVRAILAGDTLGVVGWREALTRERIRQIVRVTCVHALRSTKRTRLAPVFVGGLESIRRRKRFWLGRLRALEQFWRIPPKKELTGAAKVLPEVSTGRSPATKRRRPNTVRKIQNGR